MRKPVLYRYQVDEVPIIIRPQFYLYGYGLGLLLFILLLILRLTTKVKISGHENLRKNSNHIFCLWHSFVPLALISATPLIPAVLDRASAGMDATSYLVYETNTCSITFDGCQEDNLGLYRAFRSRCGRTTFRSFAARVFDRSKS